LSVPTREAVLDEEREEDLLFLLEEAVGVFTRFFLLLLFLVLFSFFVVLLLLLFFLGSVTFTRCFFCTADARACSEAFATGVKESVVNSKAQSVIEILVIRATGQSPNNYGQQ
jgi:uncharacterized membrane protein